MHAAALEMAPGLGAGDHRHDKTDERCRQMREAPGSVQLAPAPEAKAQCVGKQPPEMTDLLEMPGDEPADPGRIGFVVTTERGGEVEAFGARHGFEMFDQHV